MSFYRHIETRNELADFLGIPRSTLTYLLYIKHVENLYSSFQIPKKNGGIRQINSPNNDLKDIQKKIATALWKRQKEIREEKKIKLNISHGFEKDKSILTNAKIHRNKRFVLNIDLENFFDSFHFGRVRGYFEKNNDFKLPNEVATVIAQLTCYKGSLPQGAPSSPIITNLICQVLDIRTLKLAKKYKLDYTRYADDLTFSTNNKTFLSSYQSFMHELSNEIIHSGFKINDNKIRLQFKDSMQVVTGLIVNKKLNVKESYYKNTRAMAHRLYSTGSFEIDKKEATLNQLEGRFAFINQIERYNNKIDDKHNDKKHLSAREEQYRKFLFYKYFLANENPLIITEGKTDIAYIKSALKNLSSEYPELIFKDNNHFVFNTSFLKRTKRLRYLFGLSLDGADTIRNIYNYFVGKDGLPNYLNYFYKKYRVQPNKPIILIFDNELKNREKPLYKFTKHIDLTNEKMAMLSQDLHIKISNNLYLLTNPIVNGKEESEIEDLFDDATLSHEINGRKFCLKGETGFYGKEEFSKYIYRNYKYIDFTRFKPLLDSLKNIIKTHETL